MLTATVTSSSAARAAHVVYQAPLGEVPVLLVHHKDDGCPVTPYSGMPALQAALSASPKVALISEDGGSGNGNPCQTGHHQFLGIEAAVTKDIADWIKAHLAAPLK